MNPRGVKSSWAFYTFTRLLHGTALTNILFRPVFQLSFSRIGGKAFPFALTLHYTADYVYRFFRTWRGNGAKIYIPTQFAHNAALTASWGTRYHLSLEANNLTDALLYDNYSLQKPGRNVMCKLRFAF